MSLSNAITISAAGGGGGISAPTYHGVFTIQGSANNGLLNWQTNIFSGPSKIANTYAGVVSSTLSNYSHFTVDDSNGGITVTNGGKYLVRFKSLTTFAQSETQTSENTKHILRVGNVQALVAMTRQRMDIVSASAGGMQYARTMETDVEGIIDIPAGSILSLAILQGAGGATMTNNTFLSIASLF